MKKILVLLIFLVPVIAFSTTVLPNCDIVYFNNDTLFIDKIFKELILKKIEQQPDFRINDNPRKENCYTAYWEIKNDQLYLLEVSNYYYDILDLKKAFGKNYKNRKVILPIKKEILYLHKRFELRPQWGWFPTYIEDYNLQFKQNRLKHVDTIRNYVDLPNRLNRYSKFQLETQLFPILKEHIHVNHQGIVCNKITFHITVKIKNEGSLDRIGLSHVYLTNLADSTYEVDTTMKLVDLEAVTNMLTQTYWDEINNTNEDDVGFEFEYNPKLNQLTSPHFDKYVKHSFTLEMERIPWFIKKKYEDYYQKKPTLSKNDIKRLLIEHKRDTAFRVMHEKGDFRIGNLFNTKEKFAVIAHLPTDDSLEITVVQFNANSWDTLLQFQCESFYEEPYNDELIDLTDFNGDGQVDLKIKFAYWHTHIGENSLLWLFKENNFTPIQGFEEIVSASYDPESKRIYSYQSDGCGDMNMIFQVYQLVDKRVELLENIYCYCCECQNGSCIISTDDMTTKTVPIISLKDVIPPYFKDMIEYKIGICKDE